jgi:DNA-directed RNA polymerase specialized sigma24 family protein
VTSRSRDDRLDAQAVFPRLIEALSTLSQSYPEIAEALSIPVGTVRSRLNRARRRMRELLPHDPATQT